MANRTPKRAAKRGTGSSQPTHILKIYDPHKAVGVKVGVGWLDEDNSAGMSIKLNHGVHLDWKDFLDGDFALMLWPNEDKSSTSSRSRKRRRGEIPF